VTPLTETVRRVERASGALATQSVARMEERLPWFRALPADHRSWITLVAQAGIASFVDWLRRPGRLPTPMAVSAEVFGSAPRDMTRAVTLAQTVEMVRITTETLESQSDQLAAPGEEGALREAMLRYAREVAFAAAQAYAEAAESRGAWDARLEAQVVDALLRGDRADTETLASRAAALGWAAVAPIAVAVGSPPDGDPQDVLDAVQRAARHSRVTVLGGVHGDRLVLVLGGEDDPVRAVTPLLGEFGPGPVVVGPAAPDLGAAAASARAALAGLRAAPAWPAAPRPVAAADLLPERALCGDDDARRELVEQGYLPLRAAGQALLDTVTAYLGSGCSLEGTARALFVHPNTVRYRLRRVSEVCGWPATGPRGQFTLQVALALGRVQTEGGGTPRG
jgi:PucR C-terminal helix-turn-helix domain/GGDEF-like domain